MHSRNMRKVVASMIRGSRVSDKGGEEAGSEAGRVREVPSGEVKALFSYSP